jgi:hypothetical protein
MRRTGRQGGKGVGCGPDGLDGPEAEVAGPVHGPGSAEPGLSVHEAGCPHCKNARAVVDRPDRRRPGQRD